ncbi:MAG: U32 family peptidase [Peptoniphilus sp.]|nr:U32 family peptidase [Peptoniphilus sp.]MDD7362525.1 U32 family peptidase [Bacillota bacterium]MDY6045076.1 U32 family peptidase [Peptoniphilus sp.]
MKRNNVELLAPAGNMDAFYAAIQNGADAVYCGGKQFSARASAQNFTGKEMAQAVSYAHVRGKKVYVTLNILLSDAECLSALDYAADLYRIGVDGLILQDVGFSDLVATYIPDFERHGSTQMSVMDRDGAKYLESLGFSRVVVGREITPDAIRDIHDHANIEIEAFCHGALCVSISGQCEMSSYIGGRSGNRGNCAQPCRKRYRIEDEKGDIVSDRAYLISPRDLRTVEFVDELREAGVYSFKLEGRMKSSEYVAVVTRNYDRALKGERYDIEEMAQLFNRSYTRGVGFGDFGDRFVTTSRPNHRGVVIGQTSPERDGAISWRKRPAVGDLLELSVDGEKIRHTYDEKDARGTFPFTPDPKTDVVRLASVELEESLRVDASDIRGSEGVRGYFYAHVGEVPSFELKGNRRYRATGKDAVEKARSAKPDENRIRKNLSKFDASAYYLEEVELDVDDDAFLPISLINALRREAVEGYERVGRRTLGKIRVDESFATVDVDKTLLTVEVSDEASLQTLPLDKIDRLELYFLPSEKAWDYLKGQDVPVYFSFPYETPEGYEAVKHLFAGGVVQNLGQLAQVHGDIVAGEGLNIFNSYSFRHFLKLGSVMPSFECRREQLEAIYRNIGTCGEILYYGYPRSMTMRHCPMSLVKGCGSDRRCATCGFKQGYALRDEKDVAFPFRRVGDMTEIYNSLPIYLGDRSKQVMNLHPTALKIRSRLGEDVSDIVEEARRVIDGETVRRPVVEEFTRGHWMRGIL